jgi:dTDP-4-dehydrorhamnose 3,5-epimerase
MAKTVMQMTELFIPDVKLIVPRRHDDVRGFFSEVYNQKSLAAHGIDDVFVQDNHSFSARPGTIRGVHFQRAPFAQAKLVRVNRGRILDVAVDLRRASPTFGRHVSVELSAENWSQLFIPVGFGHAFCTLEPDTEVLYKVTTHYAPAADAGVVWSDPDLAIAWPAQAQPPVVSGKDAVLPRLADLAELF